jgi:hypothetical protein
VCTTACPPTAATTNHPNTTDWFPASGGPDDLLYVDNDVCILSCSALGKVHNVGADPKLCQATCAENSGKAGAVATYLTADVDETSATQEVMCFSDCLEVANKTTAG